MNLHSYVNNSVRTNDTPRQGSRHSRRHSGRNLGCPRGVCGTLNHFAVSSHPGHTGAMTASTGRLENLTIVIVAGTDTESAARRRDPTSLGHRGSVLPSMSLAGVASRRPANNDAKTCATTAMARAFQRQHECQILCVHSAGLFGWRVAASADRQHCVLRA